jgi:enoyl-CoA hydratase
VVRPADRDGHVDARLPRAPLRRAAHRRRHAAAARIVGLGRALDLILTGRLVGAREALELGLVGEVVGPGEHLDRALAIAEALAAFPQQTMFADRRAAYDGLALPLADGLAVEARNAAGTFADSTAGAARFAACEGLGDAGAGV